MNSSTARTRLPSGNTVTSISSALPRFDEISDLYAAASLNRVPPSDSFDLLRAPGDANVPASAGNVGFHRRGFFQLTYQRAKDTGADRLLASSSDQVLSDAGYLWCPSGYKEGFTLLFKSPLLGHQLASTANEFPFFYHPVSLEMPVPPARAAELVPQFTALQSSMWARGAYRDQRVSALAAALLYDVRSIYEEAEFALGAHPLCTQLVCRFDDIVLEHFRTHHTVEAYARLMHVSADHLSAEVKARTGRNAREVIAERLMAEAKHLLTHTEFQVAEIADQLGFSEPTHFTRFFRRQVGEAPLAFRRRTQPDAPASAFAAARRCTEMAV